MRLLPLRNWRPPKFVFRKHRGAKRRLLLSCVGSAPAPLGRDEGGRLAALDWPTLVYSRKVYRLQKAPISSRPNIGWRRLGMDVVSRLMESTTCLSPFVLERA